MNCCTYELNPRDFNKTIEKKFDLEYQGLVNSIVKNNSHVQATLLKDKVPQKIASFSLTPGISLTIHRIVAPNSTYFNAEEKGRPYLIKDLLSVEIGVEASLFKTLSSFITPDAGVKLKCFSMNIEHQHFSETVLSGYKTSISVHKLLSGDLDHYALDALGPGEAIKRHWSLGLDARTAAFLTGKVPALSLFSAKAGASIALSWLKAGEVTYAKDTLGSLHLIQENIRQRGLDLNINLANINANALNASLFQQRFTQSNLHQHYIDIEVAPPHYNQENGQNAYSHYDLKNAASWLAKVRQNPQLVDRAQRSSSTIHSASIPDYIQLHYNVDAQQMVQSRKHQFFYLLDFSKSKSRIDFNTQSRNHTYRFHKITAAKKGLVGIEELGLGVPMNNLLLKNGTSKKLTIEMDRDNPKKFVGILDVYDYKRTLSRDQLIDFIEDLNQRYSESEDKPFFRTDLLPSKENYKKIYANGRIYIDGAALMKRLEKFEMPGDFVKTIESTFKENKQGLNRSGAFKAAHILDDKIIARKVAKLGIELKETVTDFLYHFSLRDEGEEFKDGRTPKEMENKLASSVFDFIYTLYKSKFGLDLLQKILGKESIFVMGEIYGIHQQTGMLHDDMWKTTLRFMGSSYGDGMQNKRAPVQHYIRHEQFQPPSNLALPRLEIEHFLGPVATGLSGERVGLGNR